MADIFEQTKEIRKIWGSFREARVLLTANNYRVFDYLKIQKTAAELAKDLDADKRAMEILLDALTGLGFLKKQKGQYKNSKIASQFLVSESPYYQGAIIKHADTLWQNWSGLDTVIKTGAPYRKAQNHRAFILGMHNLAVLKTSKVLRAVGLKGVKRALDLGGGPGTYSIEMAKRGVEVTLFDRPETIEIAKKVINNPPLMPTLDKGREYNAPQPPLNLRGGVGGVKAGKGGFKRGNINFIQGDFLHDDIGKGYDLIFASQIIHSNSERDNIMLLEKCKKALNDGGRVVIQEFFISEDRTSPAQSALFSINMLVNTVGGRCYSPNELKGWLLKAGFKNVKKQIVADGVLASGRKWFFGTTKVCSII